ncbi:MAG: hypothetical protein ACRDRU_08475 [Pseudonocardiaceae bacterium]
MSQILPDALFGVDGTELPDLSGRDDWRDVPQLPPLMLPAAPDTTLQEAAVAAFAKSLTELVDQDPGMAPADRHTVPKPTITPVEATPQDLPQQPTVTAPLPAVQGPPAPKVAGGPGQRSSRPTAAVPIPPTPPRGPGRLVNLRGRVGPQDFGLRWQSQSRDGGASVVFVISLLVIVALLYAIITNIVDAVLRLIP